MPFRVGLIGYGLAGTSFHAPFIAANPELELAAIVTSDSERRARAMSEHPGARLYDGSEQMLSDDALDLVVVASPNATHVPLARAALEAGRHVVVDKPLARTASEARELYALASGCRLMLTPFQNRRWDGDFLTLQQLIAAGRLGDVYRFESRFERWRPDPKPRWRTPDAAANGEGIIYDIGAHLIDQAIALFGPVENMHAESDCRHPATRVPDDASISLTHASGVRSHLVMSTAAGQSGPRLSAYGSRGAFIKFGLDVQEDAARAGGSPSDPHWGEEPRERWGTLGAGDRVETVPTLPGNYGGFYAAVVRCLEHGAPPPVPPEEAIAVVEVLESASR